MAISRRFDGDLRGLELNAALPDLEFDGRAGLGDVLADGNRHQLVAFLDRQGFVPLHDGGGPVLPDLDRLAAVVRLAVADDQLLVVVDLDRLVAFILLLEADFQRVVVLDHAVEVLFRVEVDLLLALQVFEPQLVEVLGRTLFAAAALDAALRLIGGQRIGRHVVGVVDAAGDDRLVGVAFQKVDDHFLADAGNVHARPTVCRPRLARRGPSTSCFRPSLP